jgi:CBS domain containing-hemolysin-like protein
MSFTENLLLIVALIAASAFFALAEIALAASRRLRLRQLADEGSLQALAVLRAQEQPGHYFTAVQIGLNAVAILGGIVGEGLFGPPLAAILERWLAPTTAAALSFALSVLIVTSLFVIFADLLPKRVSMAVPERIALRLITPMNRLLLVFKPAIWLYSRTADLVLRLAGLPQQRDERITPDDILALAEAGAQAGVIHRPEQRVIENLFELETRTVSSAMIPRNGIVWLHHDDPDEVVRARIAAEPFSTYPVCRETLDQVVGTVDAKDLFQRVLNGASIDLADPALLHKPVVMPEQISLSEVLQQFRQQHEDFALIVNEFGTVVGMVTLGDVMSTVMGGLVAPADEDMIVRREDGSWLIDGLTPMSDVLRELDLEEPSHVGEYDSLAGFMMVMLRRVPRRTDRVLWDGCRFEVMDVDNYRIDQVLVTREAAGAGFR